MIGRESPAVSVIIPVCNRRELLRRALQSVVNQSFADFECIVVDDCSKEDLASIPELKAPCIHYSKLPVRSGVSRARNTGVSEARAPWIAFLDSDDEWHPAKLRMQMEWTSGHPSWQILQCEEKWIRNGTRVNPPKTHRKKEGDIFAVSLLRCMITPSSVLMRKSLFEKTGGFNESLPACEDYDLWLRITSRHPVGLVDRILLTRYGGHADQLSATFPVLDRFRIRSMLGLIEQGTLSSEQAELVKVQLEKKATIVACGYKKRGNLEAYEKYHAIARRFGNRTT
jgi:glycosyltransferase involved in cell wall biosynthesis